MACLMVERCPSSHILDRQSWGVLVTPIKKVRSEINWNRVPIWSRPAIALQKTERGAISITSRSLVFRASPENRPKQWRKWVRESTKFSKKSCSKNVKNKKKIDFLFEKSIFCLKIFFLLTSPPKEPLRSKFEVFQKLDRLERSRPFDLLFDPN